MRGRKVLVVAGAAAGVVVAAGFIGYLVNAAPRVPAIPAEEAVGRPYVVKMHARWCPICMATRGVWGEIERTYAGRVNLVVFDFTDEASTAASRAEAVRLGLGELFEEYAGVTGTVVVVDGGSKRAAAEIHGSRDFGDYRAAIEERLGTTGRR